MPEMLTDLEREFLELTGKLANMIHDIIGPGSQSQPDWHEAAMHIHTLQHLVMAQAAARAYPSEFRLLGRRIGE